MRIVTLDQELETIEFAKRAAKRFAGVPHMTTYSDVELAPGVLLAIRWGLGEDCVLVMRLDEGFSLVNFQGLVKEMVQ